MIRPEAFAGTIPVSTTFGESLAIIDARAGRFADASVGADWAVAAFQAFHNRKARHSRVKRLASSRVA